jgi:drug/metabolite transporter (DMT)-like permease
MNRNVAMNKNVIKSKKQLLIGIALFTVYLFWGGTYLGMRVAVETIPPFIMAGTRFLTAGFILYIWARLQGVKRPGKEHWKGTAIVGALLLLGGNGMIAWAEQLVPSGIASILVAMVPIWMIILGLIGKNGRKPNLGVVIGIFLGFVGISVLVMSSGRTVGHLGVDLVGIIVLLLASLSWAGGSLYSRHAKQPDSTMLATGMQMLAGGALLFIVAIFTGEWSRFHIAKVSLHSYLGLGYLILLGSIVAYNAYIWLLKNAEPAWVSTYAFVNPIVAVFLGWAIAGEQITRGSLMAAVIIIVAVVIITFYRDRGKEE